MLDLKTKLKKMIEDAESFLNRVKSKSIFNGYMIREAAWGTGSNATNIKINGNKIEFDTFDLAPVKLIEKFAAKYPEVRVIYSYSVGKVVNRISMRGDHRKDIIKNVIPEIITYSLITSNVSL